MTDAFIDHASDCSDWALAALELAGLSRRTEPVRLTGGIANHVYRVGEDVLVRLGTGSDGIHFEKAAAVLSGIQGKVPCQALIHADTSRTALPVPFMVCEYVHGTVLRDLWPNLDMRGKTTHFEAMLEAAQSIHAIEFGTLAPFANLAPWRDRQRAAMAEATRAARADPDVDPGLIQLLSDFWFDHEHLLDDAPTPVLIHNDINAGNVIFDETGHVRAFVDFDDAEVAPAEVEYWCLTEEFLDEEALSIETYKKMLSPWYGFDAPGSLERRKLVEAIELMTKFTANDSWRSRRSARNRAADEVQRYFVEDNYRRWFEDAS